MAIRTSDQISIVDLTDGYSVILTNDSYTFAGSTSAANAGSTTTTMQTGVCLVRAGGFPLYSRRPHVRGLIPLQRRSHGVSPRIPS